MTGPGDQPRIASATRTMTADAGLCAHGPEYLVKIGVMLQMDDVARVVAKICEERRTRAHVHEKAAWSKQEEPPMGKKGFPRC